MTAQVAPTIHSSMKDTSGAIVHRRPQVSPPFHKESMPPPTMTSIMKRSCVCSLSEESTGNIRLAIDVMALRQFSNARLPSIASSRGTASLWRVSHEK